jgi:hypothetical protein
MDTLGKLTVNPRLEDTLTQQLSRQLTWPVASAQLRPGDRLRVTIKGFGATIR